MSGETPKKTFHGLQIKNDTGILTSNSFSNLTQEDMDFSESQSNENSNGVVPTDIQQNQPPKSPAVNLSSSQTSQQERIRNTSPKGKSKESNSPSRPPSTFCNKTSIKELRSKIDSINKKIGPLFKKKSYLITQINTLLLLELGPQTKNTT